MIVQAVLHRGLAPLVQSQLSSMLYHFCCLLASWVRWFADNCWCSLVLSKLSSKHLEPSLGVQRSQCTILCKKFQAWTRFSSELKHLLCHLVWQYHILGIVWQDIHLWKSRLWKRHIFYPRGSIRYLHLSLRKQENPFQFSCLQFDLGNLPQISRFQSSQS